jgi:segregation and condensation protein B
MEEMDNNTPEAAAQATEETPLADTLAAAPATAVETVAEALGVEWKQESATDSDRQRLRALLEAIVYVAEEPLPAAQIAQALNQPKEVVEQILAEMAKEYEQAGHGLLIREVAGGYKMGTKPEFHEELRLFVKKLKPPLKLSLAALETLAVIAYKQPITAPEIMEIRGVQGAGVLKTLLERKLIQVAGRKQVVGRPVLYKTTKEFLLQFGLKDLSELPTLKEFEEWSRLAMGEPEAEAPPTASAPAAEPAPAAAMGEPEAGAEAGAAAAAAAAGSGEEKPAEEAGDAAAETPPGAPEMETNG